MWRVALRGPVAPAAPVIGPIPRTPARRSCAPRPRRRRSGRRTRRNPRAAAGIPPMPISDDYESLPPPPPPPRPTTSARATGHAATRRPANTHAHAHRIATPVNHQLGKLPRPITPRRGPSRESLKVPAPRARAPRTHSHPRAAHARRALRTPRPPTLPRVIRDTAETCPRTTMTMARPPLPTAACRTVGNRQGAQRRAARQPAGTHAHAHRKHDGRQERGQSPTARETPGPITITPRTIVVRGSSRPAEQSRRLLPRGT